MAPLDLSPLLNVTERLREVHASLMAQPENIMVRDAAVKRYEMAYEVATSVLYRYVDDATKSRFVSGRLLEFPVVIRLANQYRLLKGEWEDWKKYRDLRNKTAHFYFKENAEKVIAALPQFLEELDFLSVELQKRLYP